MTSAPLAGLKVLDISAVLAGPNCARYLADFGATVIKVENPHTSDSLRGMAWRDPRDGKGLWWKLVNRNKKTIALDFKNDDDLAFARRLIAEADVLVENFRPGVLERLGLHPEDLLATNPKLVIVRVTGFGQTGPYASRPGFATIAEAMGGVAAISGPVGGDPMMPAFALTDEVTGLAAAFATLVAVHSGEGQVVDVSLLESIFHLLGPLISVWLTRGELQERMGSGIPYTVPRGAYRCSDGKFIGLSTSSDSVAQRVMGLLGLAGDGRFATFGGRVEHREEIESAMVAWCAARTQEQALRELSDADAAAGPIMDMADIAADPHYAARERARRCRG